jgi:hypothetical protein
MCLSVTFGFSCVFPFTTNEQTMLILFYNITSNEANYYISIPFFMAAIFSPLLG